MRGGDQYTLDALRTYIILIQLERDYINYRSAMHIFQTNLFRLKIRLTSAHIDYADSRSKYGCC